MNNLQKLEQKIGEILGLEKAAQVAVEDLPAKGLLDEGGMKDKLQTMRRQANNHQAKLEELIPDLESEVLGDTKKAILNLLLAVVIKTQNHILSEGSSQNIKSGFNFFFSNCLLFC